jgi:hypothetical protein
MISTVFGVRPRPTGPLAVKLAPLARPRGFGGWLSPIQRADRAAVALRRHSADFKAVFWRHRARRIAALIPEETLKHFLVKAGPAPAQAIIGQVAHRHRLKPEDIIGRSRAHAVCVARDEACYRICTETDASTVRAGKLLGNRDHSTIFHGIRAHAERHGLVMPSGSAKSRVAQRMTAR